MKVYVSYHDIDYESIEASCKEFDSRDDAVKFVEEELRGSPNELISIVEGTRLMMVEPELIEMPAEMSKTTPY